MADPTYYGLEMLWKLEKGNVVTKSDLLMVFVHWYLTKNNFRNVGVGDDKTLNDSIERSELLPEGWNVSNEMYALRYAIGNELYILHGTVSSNGTMIINLLNVKTLAVSNAAFDLASIIHSVNGDKITTLITDVDKQLNRLKNDLELPGTQAAAPTAGTQTVRLEDDSNRGSDRLRDGPRNDNNRGYVPSVPPLVGQGDLDPHGRLGGGMLMDPMRPGLRFPGGVFRPPGARFDPFGPNLNRMNRPGPDNDHLPPPGYDDMFM